MDDIVSRTRKIPRCPEKWRKIREKKQRHSSARPPNFPLACCHNDKTYECGKLNMQDVRRFHQAFYKENDKIKQDCLIVKYCSGEYPKRERAKIEGSSRKGISIKYYVKSFRQTKGTTILRVCQQSFLSILQISKDRVQRVVKRHLETGEAPKELRGGDTRTKSFFKRKDAVVAFIKQFQPIESHYNRGKTMRQYLPSHLSIRKIWRAYNNDKPVSLHVNYQYFRKIFVSNFNISFRCPATDVCSSCIQYKEIIKYTSDLKLKEKLKVEYYVHKLKYKAFYDLLRGENFGSFVLCFDCQKNLILPKVTDQAAYYSRQLYSYNFTICVGNSKSPQNKESIFIYNWLENEYSKSSNEIASAVYHRLISSDLSGYDSVTLYADGAASQNKNSTMIGMLGFWLIKNAPNNIKKIHLVFPVVGHSFLPPDRVFGRIEKVIKRKETIIHPEEYTDIFAEAGTVFQLGDGNVLVLDWKSTTTENLKTPGNWHFKFQPSKRICLKKTSTGNVVVKGEVHYRSDLGKFQGICKKGKSFALIRPLEIKKGQVVVNTNKLRDVDLLLKKHFGSAWREDISLHYYKEVIDKQTRLINCSVEEETEKQEPCPEDDSDLRI